MLDEHLLGPRAGPQGNPGHHAAGPSRHSGPVRGQRNRVAALVHLGHQDQLRGAQQQVHLDGVRGAQAHRQAA